MKCPKCSSLLKSILVKNSILIETCTGCKGVWFDKGEINFFVKDPKNLVKYYTSGLLNSKQVLQSCPKCIVNLNEGNIPGFRYTVEECPSCKGLFLDEHEVNKIGQSEQFIKLIKDKMIRPQDKKKKTLGSSPSFILPLGLTCTLVLGLMFAIVFGFMVFFVESGYIEYQTGILFTLLFILLQFITGPSLMDWNLTAWGSLKWIEISALPEHLKIFISNTCSKHSIPEPKIGIISDGAPQAYTYGQSPKKARLVLSEGILNLLTPEEIEAVVAHELGHIVHRDFIIMTITQMVPILLYHIYHFLNQLANNKSKENNKSKYQLQISAILAYIFYIITRYLSMFISRTREYWADRFSVQTTKNPDALIQALSKISYGSKRSTMAKPDTRGALTFEKEKTAIEPMAIMNLNSSKALAIYAHSKSEDKSQILKEIMQWDLWNPWATYFELKSTHPLLAKRINAIASEAFHLGIEPSVLFDLDKPESFWDDFMGDLFFLLLPIFGAIFFSLIYLLFSENMTYFKFLDLKIFFFMGLGIGGIIKTSKIYPGSGTFLDYSILSLLKKVKVSPVTAYPVRIKGSIIGRGDPGNLFSEDMVIQDNTGMIILDYQQPIGFLNFIFALYHSRNYQGNDVLVEGWYRRSPIPYIEIYRVKTKFTDSTVYTIYFKFGFWIFFLCLSFLLCIAF